MAELVSPAPSSLQQPLIDIAPSIPRKPVQVYSPYGKEVVDTQEESGCMPLRGFCFGRLLSFSTSNDGDDWEVMFTIKSSIWFNFLLFLFKFYAYVASGSLAVLASLVDSTIDLLGQGVLLYTKQLANARAQREDYPIGRERLEPVGVMVCSVVMGMASIEVITTSAKKLIRYWGKEDVPPLELTETVISLLVFIIVVKYALHLWCNKVLERHPGNEAVKAIAQDNLNDVLSNTVALIAPWLTQLGEPMWVADPTAGILISVYIIKTWVEMGFEQVEMIAGKRADVETLSKIQTMAETHHPDMQLDQLCAYHFGPRYLVEVEVVMPETTTLRQSHDEGIKLQHKIESLDDVERCFVHIDYQLRECDDHDPNVPIEEKIYGGPRPGSPRGALGLDGCLDA
jgi:cation diffusion facilitator family transporter